MSLPIGIFAGNFHQYFHSSKHWSKQACIIKLYHCHQAASILRLSLSCVSFSAIKLLPDSRSLFIIKCIYSSLTLIEESLNYSISIVVGLTIFQQAICHDDLSSLMMAAMRRLSLQLQSKVIAMNCLLLFLCYKSCYQEQCTHSNFFITLNSISMCQIQ